MTDTNADVKDLLWEHRLTVIRDCNLDLAKPQVVQRVCDVMGIHTEEVDALVSMEESGDWKIDPTFDTSPYRTFFDGANDLPPLSNATVVAEPTATNSPSVSRPTTKPTIKDKPTPQTASRVQRPPKKRGRKGTKIEKAFAAVPSEPIDANSFAKKHDVSMAVLRQSKRFDKSGEGTVRVKQVGDDKVLMIWREVAEPTEQTSAAPTAETTQDQKVHETVEKVESAVAGATSTTDETEATPDDTLDTTATA